MRFRTVFVSFSFFSLLAATPACDDYNGALPTLPSADASAPGDVSGGGDGGEAGAPGAVSDGGPDAPSSDAGASSDAVADTGVLADAVSDAPEVVGDSSSDSASDGGSDGAGGDD
jgi:hypothetical protein